MIRPSRANFSPDALSALVPATSPLTQTEDGDFTDGFSIDKLSSYWNSTGDVASKQEFRIVFYNGVPAGHYGEVYTYHLVTDTVDDFSNTPATLATSAVASDVPSAMEFVVAREQLDGTTDSFIGLEIDMADGYPVGYIAFSDAATEADAVSVADEAHKKRTITISGTLTADDAVTIDDGTSTPVQFLAKATGAVIADHEFNIGASGTDSATNLQAAINFAVTATDLVDVTVSRATAVLTVVYPVGGTVTEDVDFGNKIVVSAETNVIASLLFGTHDTGSLVYTAVMVDGDGVTIDDDVHDPVTFTFKNAPDYWDPTEVAVGTTATTSAQNIRAAILNMVALGLLSVTATGGSTTITIKNHATTNGLINTTGSIVETVDSGTHQAVTDFTGGIVGVENGTTAAESASNLLAAINAGTYSTENITAFELSATSVGIVNKGAVLGVASGVLTETADTGTVITVTDFAVPTAALNFWAYVAPCNY